MQWEKPDARREADSLRVHDVNEQISVYLKSTLQQPAGIQR